MPSYRSASSGSSRTTSRRSPATSRRSDTPDNRENVNFLSTGPDFTIGLTARTSLQLSGRVSDTYYEERDTDSQGLSGSVALIRQMSDISSLSLNGSTSETDFDEEVFSDFRIDSGLSALADGHASEPRLILDGGYNRVSQDDQFDLIEDDASGGLLARLEFSRAVGARSRFGVVAGTGLETPGQGLRRIQDVIGVDPGDDEDAIVGERRVPRRLCVPHLQYGLGARLLSPRSSISGRSRTKSRQRPTATPTAH